jgi:hypothetical protein
MVLVLDLQEGLYQLSRDWDSTLYYNNMIAHAAVAKLFDLPVVLTTSAQTGQYIGQVLRCHGPRRYYESQLMIVMYRT